MADSVEHLRARYADSRMREHFASCRSPEHKGADALTSDVTLRQYRSVISGAATFVRQCGIVQVAAFWCSKKEAEDAALADVLAWLSHADNAITRPLCVAADRRRPIDGDVTPRVDAIQALLQRSADELRRLDAESVAIIAWLSRFAEGRYKAVEPNDANPPETVR